MKTLIPQRLLTLVGLLALAACDGASPMEALLLDPMADEALELAVLADEGALETTLDLATMTTEVGFEMADARAARARDLGERARARFENARDALAAGDRDRALEEAREGRRLVADALRAMGDDEAVLRRIEWLEMAALTAVEDGDVLDDPAAARAELARLAEAASAALARGDTLGAGERVVLGEQRVHQRRRPRDVPDDAYAGRARLRVALAGTAVALAERLVSAQDAPHEEQLRHLAIANRLLEAAEAALGAGRLRRAVHFAELATWSALRAVVLPGGVTREEARAMHELATSLLEDARAAVGEEPTALQQALLRRAHRLLEIGEAQLRRGNVRGVGALWQSAVISRWLIG